MIFKHTKNDRRFLVCCQYNDPPATLHHKPIKKRKGMKTTITQIEGLTAEQLQAQFVKLHKELADIRKKINGKSDNDLLTRKETADILKISLPTLWAWTNKGIIPAYRIGNKVRYKKADILTALHKMN